MAPCLINFAMLWMTMDRFLVSCVIHKIPDRSFLMPSIFWDPRNPLFFCPSRGINTINVRMHDFFVFGCQTRGTNIGTYYTAQLPFPEMYENAFFTDNENQAKTCNATGISSTFLTCADPFSIGSRSIRVAAQSAMGEDPRFTYNRTYYVFGTGNGLSSGLNNRVGGRCRGDNPGSGRIYNMTLKIRTCPKGEANTKSCPICTTVGCYNDGCGTYSEWNRTYIYQRHGETCYEVYKRTCDYIGGNCDGPSEKLVASQNISACVDLAKWNLQNIQQQNGSYYARFQNYCGGDNATVGVNATNANNRTNSLGAAHCNRTEMLVKVANAECSEKPPIAEKLKGENDGMVSLVVSLFIISLICPSIIGILFGFVVGWLMAKKKFRRTSALEDHRLTPRRKDSC